MKKNLLIILGLLLIIGYFLGIRKLENFVLKEAVKVLPEFVTISQIRINPFSNVSISDVKIVDVTSPSENIFSASNVRIRFNIIKGIKEKDLSAISALVLDEPVINVKHFRDDSFNLVALIEKLQLPTSDSQEILGIDLNIRIKNGKVEYYDERGFGEEPFEKPIVNTAFNVNGIVNYKDGHLKIRRFFSNLNKEANKLFFSGEYFGTDYWFKIKGSGCEISKEINYFIPLEAINFKTAEGDIEIVLKTNEVKKKTDLPIRFDVEYKSRNTLLELDWLSKDILINDGILIVNNKRVQLENLDSSVEDEKFKVNGKIDDFYKLDIKIKSKSTNMEKVERVLPFLQVLKLRGKGMLDVSIVTNKEDKIVISGKVENFKGKIIGYELDRGTATFTFADNKVDFVLPEVNAYKGVGRGYGYVEMSPDYPPYVSTVVDIRGIEIFDYFKAEPFQGKVDLALRINSYTEQLNGLVDIVGIDSNVFGQDLLQARLFWQLGEDRIEFSDNSFLVVNTANTAINIEGFLKKDNNFFIAFSESSLFLDDFYFFYTNTGNYFARALFNGSVSGVFDDVFKADPVSHIQGEISGTVNAFQVITPNMKMTGKFKVVFDKGLHASVDIKNKESTLGIRTSVVDKKLKSLMIKTNKMNLGVAKSFVKPIGVDYEGKVSCDITIFPDENALFMKSQGVTGSVSLIKSIIASQDIDFFEGQISLKKDKVAFNDARLINKGTDLLFSGEYMSTANFNVKVTSGSISSQGWSWLPTGIKGEIKSIKGIVSNKVGKINFDFDVSLQDAIYRGVFLPNIQGNVSMDDEKIRFENVNISHFKDNYAVSGNLFLNPMPSGINPFDINIDVINGELENIFDLFNSIQINWRNKSDLIKKEAETNTDIFNTYNDLLKKETKRLYSLAGDNISSALDSLKVLEQGSEVGVIPGIYGTLKGNLHIAYGEEFLLFSDIALKDGRYQFISAKEIRLVSDLKDNFFEISLQGDSVRLMNKYFDELSLFANYYPTKDQIEIVNCFAKIGDYKTNDLFKGNINLKDAFNENPNQKTLDLYVFFDKDDIDFLTIVHKSFSRITNKGTILLHITGPLVKPVISSYEATLKDFELMFAPSFMLRTPIRVASANLVVKDSVVILPKDMSIQWQGLDTSERLNEFICNGEIAFLGFLNDFAGLAFDLNIKVNPMFLHLNIRDFFQGGLKMFDTSIEGQYIVAMKKELIEEQFKDVLSEKEKGPVLKSKVFIERGIYQLPLSIGGNTGKLPEFKPSLLLDLQATLGKDIQIVQKSGEEDINRWFTNINIVFEERPELLKVQGSLNTIDTDGIFKFNNGRIIFLNKVFNLMDRQKQREVFGAGSSEIGDNFVEVKMEQHSTFQEKRRLVPYFNIKTFSEVQKQTNVTDSVKYEDHLFVIFIQGPINDLSSFFIEHYKKDETGYILQQGRIYLTEMTPEQMDTVLFYLVPAVFRPDFYRSLLQEGLADNQEANAMLREYSASQINLWIDQQLRPFEQEIARNMGLYDVNINHDLGGELVNAMQVFQQRESSALKDNLDNSLSVEYVKDLFFKKFFVKVKTGISQDPTKPLLNMSQYELVWFLNDYLSLNYGNYNMNNIDTRYGAFSINANFIF